MRRCSVLLLGAVLASCQATPKPSVVTEVVKERNVEVPPVQPPPPFKPAQFKFQRPEAPNGVVAMDSKNYTLFREFTLGINQREIQWQNRLDQANSSIRLLQGVTEQSTTGVPTQ